MKDLFIRAGRLWCAGAVLLVLRLLQNQSGFDAVTGLAKSSLPGTLLLILLAVCTAAELALCFRLPKRSAEFADLFAPPEKNMLTALVLGCGLLAAGGVLLAADAFPRSDIAAGAAGVLAIAAGAGLAVLNRQARAGTAASITPLLPSMFFGVFLVLAVYLPLEDDPVFFRYYLPILAASAAAYAFSQLAGFCREETSLRSFQFSADMAVLLCLASAADAGIANALLFLGCAAVFSVYLLLRREPDKLAPEKPKKKDAKKAGQAKKARA